MPMQPDWPTIRSEGTPPERHADRVISEMTRGMHGDLHMFGPWMEALFNSADVGVGSGYMQNVVTSRGCIDPGQRPRRFTFLDSRIDILSH